MTTEDDEQTRAHERLVSAMKELDVSFRIDAQGRLLAFDGKQEYEVIVNLSRLLTKVTGIRRRGIAVGTASLARLERGDITALFPHGVVDPAKEPLGIAAIETPVSPYYRPLMWDQDFDNYDDDDAIAAQGDDWTYRSCPVRGDDDEVIGYRVSGGDWESGDEFGSSLIGGDLGELTLAKAKAAALAHYASRYLEADQFLDDLLGDYEDDDGRRTRRNDQGRIVCRVDLPGVDEVEVVATLGDCRDGYDPNNRRVTLCLRTILACNGDRSLALDQLGRIIGR